MDPILELTVYNLPSAPPNLDRIGIFFVSFLSVWTFLVTLGLTFLIINRNHPVVKIRGLPLSLGSVCMLHAYWCLGQVVYPFGATMPVMLAYSIQYFFMGIWYPLGIALFHASNLRFLHIAKMQRQYTELRPRRRGCDGAKSSVWCQLRNMSYTTRVMTFISIGIVFQILLTVGMWLACRRYHPSFGIPGTELPDGTPQQQIWWLGQGWEWWPTLAWQFIWSWIVAPYLLVKSWHIDDTMGWRTQTIGCCIASLPATPIFLVACYVPDFQVINMYFTPSNWLHLSIMVFVIFTVFIPCWQVIAHRRLSREAIDSNARRESESRSTFTAVSVSSPQKASFSLSLAEEGKARSDILEIDDDRLLTMSALDHVVRTNPKPLQNFSALRDFSGENIAFLSAVASWKSTSFEEWEDADKKQKIFTKALEVYTMFISPRDAEFPINLSWRQLKPLEDVFEAAARLICGDCRRGSDALPFEFEGPPTEAKANARRSLHEIVERVQYAGPISEAFNAEVFDEAAAHIRQLVFLNTWPKFVRELRQRRPSSSETERSGHSWSSGVTLVDKTATYIRGFFK